jgi:hypothetical protein
MPPLAPVSNDVVETMGTRVELYPDVGCLWGWMWAVGRGAAR